MAKLQSVTIKGENFFYSLSFDIDEFIGDGAWWLQVYDDDLNLIYDKPLASSMGKLDEEGIWDVIQNEFITYKGTIL